MTKGSQIHEDFGIHLRKCIRCRTVDPESIRIANADHTISEPVLLAMCPAGRQVYEAYLAWLKDE